MKLLFYLLTAAAHPFGLYVVVPLYMEHCYVVTGSDGAGRAMAAAIAIASGPIALKPSSNCSP